jgi:hypothetical protein
LQPFYLFLFIDEQFNTRANHTIVVAGIPDTLTNGNLIELFVEGGFNVLEAEMILNPDGKYVICGFVQILNISSNILAYFNILTIF